MKNFVGVILLLVLLVAAPLAARPSAYYLITPGGAYEIEPRLRVPDEYRQEMGRLAFTAVYAQPASWIETAAARVSGAAEIVPAEQIRPAGTTQEQINERNRELIDESKPIAAAVALRAAGYDVQVSGEGARVEGVLPDMPASGVLQEGDVIVAVDGQPIQTSPELVESVRRHQVGDQIRLTIRRGDATQDVTVGTRGSPTEPDRPVVGVLISTVNFHVSLPFPVDVDSDGVGGPSAGLMFALGILDGVTEGDLTRGHFVAGTGTIAVDGSVGPIGGAAEKVIAAERAGADVFLVPTSDLDDARSRVKSARLLPVDRFADSVRALCGLDPRGDAAADVPPPCAAASALSA